MQHHIDAVVARRLLGHLRPEIAAEFSHFYITTEQPITAQDAEATAHLRVRVESILGEPVAGA